MSSDSQLPWKRSKSGNIYCRFEDAPYEIKSMLSKDNNYFRRIEESTYKVRIFKDNSVIVFMERTGENKEVRTTCKICAENGFLDIPIKWHKKNEKWVPYEYVVPTRVHLHLQQDSADRERTSTND